MLEYIFDIKGSSFGIYDSDDDTVEYVDIYDVENLLKQGYKIKGVHYIDGTVRFSRLRDRIFKEILLNGTASHEGYTYTMRKYGNKNVVSLEEIPSDTLEIYIQPFVNIISADISEHNFVTLNVSGGIGLLSTRNLFSFCTRLQELNLSEFCTRNVENMSGMFDKLLLDTIDVSHLNTEKVTSFSKMFHNSYISHIDLSNFKISDKGVAMDDMFSYCIKLKKVILGKSKGGVITDMSSMFEGCRSLEELDLSALDTKSVYFMQGMFQGCESLKHMDLSSFDTSALINHMCMFDGCFGDASYYKFDVLKSKERERVFKESALNGKCTIGNYTYKARNNNGVVEITLTQMEPSEAGVYIIPSYVDYIDAYCYLEPNADGEIILYGGGNLKSTSLLFEGNSAKTINLRNFDTFNVENMQRMFLNCRELTNIIFGRFKTGGVKTMCGMFRNCIRLEKFDCDFDTTQVEDMSLMFTGCDALKEVDLTSFETPNLKRVERMFSGCHRLQSIYMRNFDFSKCKHLQVGMFNSDMLSLTTDISDEVRKQLIEIHKNTHIDCNRVFGS